MPRAESRHPSRDWTLPVCSALLYTLAFNLIFFIQELFLVVPKALTPGLRPTLFHNNHGWEGDHSLASLFQGTGALATLIVGLGCTLLLRRGHGGPALRLFLFWMAFAGIFMALPQVVIGAISPASDVGMAMEYLQLGTPARIALAMTTLIVMPLAALWLLRPLLSTAGDVRHDDSASPRVAFVFRAVTLPALVALVLVVPFRVPREWIEVLLLPVIVTIPAVVWMQAGAWLIAVDDGVRVAGTRRRWPIVWPLAAVSVLLLVFQVVLRPGVAFY